MSGTAVNGQRSTVNGHRVSQPWAAALVLLAACAVTPLTNHIAVGEEAFVIGVGEGPDRATDLYAAPASGGSFVRLTFNRLEERAPRLSPSGTSVAFFRGGAGAERPGWSVIVLDLRTNAEHAAEIPGGGEPERLGWSADGTTVVVLAGGYFAVPAGPGAAALTAIPGPGVPSADSLTQERLGEPPSAVIRRCAGTGLCITGADGETSTLDPGATGAIRWGADSVAYFTPRGFVVRPLAGGYSRRPVWNAAPAGLRTLTYHPGAANPSR